MWVLVVHTSQRVGVPSGLFGLSGDAPVQVVDVMDQVRVTAFFDLAKEYEYKGIRVCQTFHQESPEALSQELQDLMIKGFGSNNKRRNCIQHLCFDFVPNKMCNHSDPADHG